MTKLTFHCGAIRKDNFSIDGQGERVAVYQTNSTIITPRLPDGSLGSPAPCVQACPKKRPSGRKVKRILVDKYAPLGYLITCVPAKVEEVK